MTVAFIHASRAAIEPVANYFTARAPDLDCVHLLDDGIMRFLAAQDTVRSERRFLCLVETARDTYGASIIVLTCSAVPRETMDSLRIAAGIPLFKIDEPMAQLAAACGTRIGVLATFAATLATTRGLLEEAEPGIAVVWELEEEALKALLAGDRDRHDELFLAAAQKLAAREVEAVVLAQVSMARLQSQVEQIVKVPVFNSLETSLAAVRNARH
jgi:aspartate/glutamate racemase